MKYKIMNTLLLTAVASVMSLAGCNKVEDLLVSGLYPTKGINDAAYYIDSQDGDDSNDGKSPETAWKTLERLDKVILEAGNSILLKKGSIWSGQLSPRGAGSVSSPARIGSYGTGDMPVINGGGMVDAAIKLTNQSNWIIEGIEVTNTAPLRDAYRCGIMVENSSGVTVSNIVIRGNRIHDITGSFKYSGVYHPHQFGGISVTTKSVETGAEKFDNILIENNVVERIGRTGIVVWDFVWGGNTHSSTNVVIRGNTVRQADSDGILTYGCNGALIEHNLADGCGSYREDGGFNGAAAIWCTRGRDCVIQHNEACNTKALEGNADGTGFDIDLETTDCIMQYNYSHDNEGGFMLLIDAYKESPSPSSGNIVRYNISQNDGERIFMIAGGVTPGLKIYNNTIYIGEALDTKIIDHTWDGAGNLNASWSFQNNIIYNLGSGDYNIPGTGGVFSGNVYYGNHPGGEPGEADKLTVDPGLVNPGSGGEGPATLDGYKLREDSPLINAGVQISSNGGLDFWGNPVSRRGQASIGAHEPNGEVQEGGYLYDPLDDWSVVYSYSANFELDGSNPQYFDEDASRAVRQTKDDGVLVYNLEGFKSAKLTVFLGVWYGAASPDAIGMYVSQTGDESDYTPVATRGQSAGEVAEGFQKFEVFINETLPDGLAFLKVVVSDAINEAWAIQIGEIEISDEPAEVIVPTDNTFTDPLDNKSLMSYNSGDNLIVAWSSQEDIDAFFNGDAGRIARGSGAAETMAWQYGGIVDFSITIYYCGDPGANPDFLKVYGTSVFSLETLVEIPVSYTLVATRGDWREYLVKPASGVASGYNYLALNLTQSTLVPNGWELQIGKVVISDEDLGGGGTTPAEGILDPLADVGKMAWHDNIMAPWSSEEDITNFFEGDATRICRVDGAVGAIAYGLESFDGFTITAYFCGDPGQNPFLNVYGAPVLDLGQAQPIACTYTLAATYGDWRKFIITPQAPVSGYNYLAIQMPVIDGAEHWAVQLAEVAVTN